MAKKNTSRRKWPWIVAAVFLVIILSIGGYAYSIYHSVEKTFKKTEAPLHREKSEKREEPVSLVENEPISVLLLGVDKRGDDRGRSDSMILLTVNAQKESVKMVSIPRDTRTEIIGKGLIDKINHAYAFGGVDMSVETVEKFLDIPIDYYITVNMESFRDIVDAVGGVHVTNSFTFAYEGHTFKKGTIQLDGNEALAYTRMRKQDPNGDFGREQRQRQVIQAVIEEGASFSSLANYQDILNTIAENIKTNLTFDDMVHIQQDYRNASKQLEQIQITGNGTKINGVYYLQVPDSERLNISQTLKDQLHL